MKEKYCSNYFRIILPMGIVCSLIIACSRVSEQYAIDDYSDNPNKKDCLNPNTSFTNSAIEKGTNKDQIDQKLFSLETQLLNKIKNIGQGENNIDINSVQSVQGILQSSFTTFYSIIHLKDFCYKNEILHKLASVKGNNQDTATAIIKLLLDKLGPTFFIGISFKKIERYKHFTVSKSQSNIIPKIKNNIFWEQSQINRFLKSRYPLKSITNLLLQKNNSGKTPLCIAAESRNLKAFTHLLEATHIWVGLYPEDHIDKKRKDLLGILHTTDQIDILVDELYKYASHYPFFGSQGLCCTYPNCLCTYEEGLNLINNVLKDVFLSKEAIKKIRDLGKTLKRNYNINSSKNSSPDSFDSGDTGYQNSIQQPMQENIQKRLIIGY